MGLCISLLWLLQDGLMLGAVGAYGWSGTVVHQTGQKFDALPKKVFESTLDDRNHSSYLGERVDGTFPTTVVSHFQTVFE